MKPSAGEVLVPALFRSHLPPVKPRVTFSDEIARRILAGLEQGRGLRAICREPGMPTRASVMRWFLERPGFAELAHFARYLGGLDGAGLPCRLRNGLGDRIFDRLCAGEPLRTLCRDPAMPSRSTVHAWVRRYPEFADAVALARDIASWEAANAKWKAVRASLWG